MANIITVEHPFEEGDLLEEYPDFQEQIYVDNYPFEQMPTRQFRHQDLMTDQGHSTYLTILAKDNDMMVGRAIIVQNNDGNADRVFIRIDVPKQYRHRGYGRQLAAAAKQQCIQRQITIYETAARSHTKNRQSFTRTREMLEQVKIKQTNVEKKSRLYQDQLDIAMIRQWNRKTKEKLPEIEILAYTKQQYRERILEDDQFAAKAVAYYNEVTKLVPQGDSSRKIKDDTVEQVRQQLQQQAKNNWDNYVIFALIDDNIIGSTLVYFPQGKLIQVNTGLTAVRKQWWGRSIASYLKTEMILNLCEKGFDHLDTENAENNAAILHINQKLGFEEIYQWYFFEGMVADLPDAIR